MVYAIHVVSALVFILLIPLPFFVMKMKKNDAEKNQGQLKFWRIVLLMAHLALVISLVSGFIMTPVYTSGWFWTVMVVFVALGALLGIVMKNVRLLTEKSDGAVWNRLMRMSVLLSVAILIQFMLMSGV